MNTTSAAGSTMAKRQFLNAPPTALPDGAPHSAVKAEFGRRIQALLVTKGWNQSDLAKQASKHMPGRQQLTRDNVSNYVRGQQLPGPVRLRALCGALGVSASDLLPAQAMQSVDDAAPPLSVKALANGQVFLQINQVTSMDTAMKVMTLLGNHKVEGA